MGQVSPQRLQFPSRSARILAAVIWAVLGFAWWGAWPLEGQALATATLVSGGIAAISLPVLWRPTIVVDHTGLTVHNPLFCHRVSWSAVTRIDTRFALRLITRDRHLDVWAAVAPGRHHSFWATKDQGSHLPESTYQGALVSPGDLIGSESGEIGAVIRRYWEESRSTDASTTEHTSIESSPSWPAVALLAAGAVALLAAGVLWAA